MNVLKNHIYFNIDKLGELVKNSLSHYDENKHYLRSFAKFNNIGLEVVVALDSSVYGYLLFDENYMLYDCGFKDKDIEKYYIKRHKMPIDEDLLNCIVEGKLHWRH